MATEEAGVQEVVLMLNDGTCPICGATMATGGCPRQWDRSHQGSFVAPVDNAAPPMTPDAKWISGLWEEVMRLRARLEAFRGIHEALKDAIEQHKARGRGGMQVPGSALSYAPLSALKMLERDIRHALEKEAVNE